MAKTKTHTYTIPSSSTSTIEITISEPPLTSENLGLETWASSHILASQLHHLTPSINFPSSTSSSCSSPKVLPILELGAGTGLVGISAAALWKQPVVLTDLSPIVPGLEANISLNTSVLEISAGAGVEAGTLDWKVPTTLTTTSIAATAAESEDSSVTRTETHARVIFAADTIYSPEHPELLTNVVLKWLVKDEHARFIMAYPLRGCYIEEIREMWQRLEDGGLVALTEGRQVAEEDLFDDERLVEWSVWGWKDL